MQLDNFDLEIYSESNQEHQNILKKVTEDKTGRQYLGNIMNHVNSILKRKEEDYLNNNIYIAIYNQRPIGYIALTHHDDIYEITSGLIKEARGEHLGALLLQEFSEEIFENLTYIDKLTLVIDNKNIGSIKAAQLVGYQKENGNYYTQKRR